MTTEPPVTELVRQAAHDLANCHYAIALTGAGMSTESGVPDYRGPRGVWTTNRQAEAMAYQRYNLFLRDPASYWQEMSGEAGSYGAFYRQLRKAEPNAGHYALAELEELGRIGCVITQNIDGLHEKAGSRNVIHYHGSIDKLRCASCGLRFGLNEVSLEKLPPYCHCGGAIKYDVVHFTEPIPADIIKRAADEASRCDLMLICGTSAVVYPFAALPRELRLKRGSAAKIVEINAQATPLTLDGVSDYFIQGRTGEVLPSIVREVKLLMKSGESSSP
jgi:NAD-dependent deacetylase